MVTSGIIKEGYIKEISQGKAVVKFDALPEYEYGEAPSEVVAKIDDGLHLDKGDRVVIVGKVKGWLSGWALLAGLPFFAILLALIGGFFIGFQSGLVAGGAIAVTAGYYIFLYYAGDRITSRLEWVVEGLDYEPVTINSAA